MYVIVGEVCIEPKTNWLHLGSAPGLGFSPLGELLFLNHSFAFRVDKGLIPKFWECVCRVKEPIYKLCDSTDVFSGPLFFGEASALSLTVLNLMLLQIWASARFGELQDKKMMITGGDTNAFHFNEVCSPFFTSVSLFFAEVVIALQGFWGSTALSETLS